MIEPFLHLCCGFIFPILTNLPPLARWLRNAHIAHALICEDVVDSRQLSRGGRTRSAPTRLFASQVGLFVLLVNSTQLSREAYLRQSPT